MNAASSGSADELVTALEVFSGSGESAAPRRLRTEEARSIVDLIAKSNSIGKEHLERIIDYAMRSSDYCWDKEEESSLHMEFRRVARLYDTIAETAERKLASLREPQ